jgi:hypothetical protein
MAARSSPVADLSGPQQVWDRPGVAELHVQVCEHPMSIAKYARSIVSQ